MKTPFDAQNAETSLAECGNEFGTAERGSCCDGHALDADELQFLHGRALYLQAQRDGFSNTLGDFIERARLGVACWDLRNRGDVVALWIALNHYVELTGHWIVTSPFIVDGFGTALDAHRQSLSSDGIGVYRS